MTFLRILIGSILGFCLTPLAAFAQSTDVQDASPMGGSLVCGGVALPQPACILRTPRDASLRTLRAIEVDSGQRITARFQPFSEAGDSGEQLAIILIDNSTNARSDGPADARKATLEQVQAAVLATYDGLESTEVAVVVYGEEAVTAAAFGASRDQVAEIVRQLTFDDLTTRSYSALQDAVATLAQRSAIRRSIYLFTDGLAEDSSQSASVITAAQNAEVEISSLVVHWFGEGEPKRGRINTEYKTLADATGGVSSFSGPQDRPGFNPSFIERLQQQAASNGIVTVDELTQRTQIQVELSTQAVGESGPTISVLAGVLEPNEVAPPPAPEPEPEAFPPWMIAAAAAAMLLLLLAILFFVLRRRKTVSEEEFAGEMTIDPQMEDQSEDVQPGPFQGSEDPTRNIGGATGPVGQLLARLVMSADGEKYEVRSPKISIGRSAENDVVLQDDSISRFHSELHRMRDGTFAVTDLSSLNHTKVNGKIVKTQVLKDGDRIELGNVGFSFDDLSRETVTR